MNCENCGAPHDDEGCSYCGTGVKAALRRLKQSAIYLIGPRSAPKVAKQIQVSSATAIELREAAKHNRAILQEQACADRELLIIDRKIAQAVLRGHQKVEIGQMYIRCDEHVQKKIDGHFMAKGMRLHKEISWTSQTPPAWHMARFDIVWIVFR